MQSVGSWIKQRRKALGLTQAELAQRVGCATVTLQKIELNERRPSQEMAERVCQALEVLDTPRPAFLRSARGELPVDRLGVEASSGRAHEARLKPTPRPGHNLPAQTTSFIEREREVSLVLALLRREDVRLLTLTGPGGTGKTRVSLRAAGELLDAYPDGVWLVDLASIRDPAMVPSAIATVLGVREMAGRPLHESLQAYLAPKQTLLVLDNFEQVLAAAPVVAGLLAAAPRLKALVTSRSVIGVYGEQTFVVPPLGLPDLPHQYPAGGEVEQLARTEAVALFVARAHAANPAFALTAANAPDVIEICRRLDGLPLALELAAARSRLLAPQALLQRLGSRLQLLTGGPRTQPARQQTLRATLDWSYDLLTPDEQALLRRVAVFAGGWTLEAVEAVCTVDDTPAVAMLDVVASLADKSLLRQGAEPNGEPRFSMLETIREYALERLVATGELAALRERHAHYYLHWLEAMQAQYRSDAVRGQQDEVVGRVRAELGNLAATLEWTTEHGEWDHGLRWEDATASFRFVERLGWVSQAWKRWDQELMDSRGTVPMRTWVAALVRIGRFAYWEGDLPQAATLLEESLALARRLDDHVLIVQAQEWLGHAYREQDMYVRAAPLYEENMARAQARGAPFDIASAHHCLGELALLQEDYPRALAQAQASLPFFRALAVQWGIACASINQGFAALHLGDDDLAARCFPEALRIAQLYDGGSHIRGALAGFVAMAARSGTRDAGRAAFLLGALAEGPIVYAHRRACDRILAATHVQGDTTAWQAAYIEGRRMTLEQAAAYALGLNEPA